MAVRSSKKAAPKIFKDWPVRYSDSTLAEVEQVVNFARLFKIEIEPFQRLILSELLSDRREVMVCIPKGNGKSGLLAIVCLWHLVTHPEPEVYVGASSRDQASILWRFVMSFAQRSSSIVKRLQIRHNIIKTKNGRGFMRPLAADAPRIHGIAPTLAVVDELWAHRNPEVYTNFKTSLAKKNGKVAVLTTAGDDSSTTLAEMRKKALALPDKFQKDCLTFTYDDSASFSFFEWAVPADGDFKDLRLVKKANPFSQITEQIIREELEAPGLPEYHFRQFRCNQWIESGDPWLPEGAWEACLERGAEIPDGGQIWMGLDIGWVYDATALILLHPRDDGKTVVKAEFWIPRGDGTQVEITEVEERIKELAKKYELMSVAFDPNFFTANSQRLVDEGIPMMQFPQSEGRMVAATATTYEAIMEGRIVHDGDPELTRHINGAAFKHGSKGARLTKIKGKRNDGAIALAIGFRDMEWREIEPTHMKNPLLVLGFEDEEQPDPFDEWFD